MQAARLSERIVIRRKSANRDNTTGAETVTWNDDAPIWAAAEPIRGREYAALMQAESETEIRFTIHYQTGITPDARVVWRDVVYELVSPPIDVGAKKRYLELMCRTSQNG